MGDLQKEVDKQIFADIVAKFVSSMTSVSKAEIADLIEYAEKHGLEEQFLEGFKRGMEKKRRQDDIGQELIM